MTTTWYSNVYTRVSLGALVGYELAAWQGQRVCESLGRQLVRNILLLQARKHSQRTSHKHYVKHYPP